MAEPSRSQRLLDAQVAWLLARLQGEELGDLVEQDVDRLLAIGTGTPVGALVEPAAAKAVLRLLLTRVPSGAAASTVVQIAADTAYDGPAEAFTLREVVEREHVEALLEELLQRVDLVGAVLDRVAESPLAASLGARVVARVVGDVVAANRAVAERIPGLGPLVSLGNSVAGAAGAMAAKPLEGLVGDTAGKGATIAVRRLNKVIVETLKDPSAKAAALQVFDLYADHPVGQVHRTGSREDTHRLAGLLQDVVIAGAATEPVLELSDALVDGFFAVYAEVPASVLVADLGIERDDLVAHARRLVPGLVRDAVASGEAERLLRAHLEPFFASPEVAAILDEPR
jgi:hypothetical protein